MQIVNSRPKTDFLPEDFPKLLKRSLVFGARVVVRPFSLKLRSITMSFESDISNDNLQGNVYKQTDT